LDRIIGDFILGMGEICMNNNKMNFYFFGEPGHYDCYNPAYVCDKEYAPEVIYKIASCEPFSIHKEQIIEGLNIGEEIFDDIIRGLSLIDAIETKNNTYRVKFPVFLERDVLKLEEYLKGTFEVIGEKIISVRDLICEEVLKLECSKHYSSERILYHIICDEIFDGAAFDFFSDRNIFCTSKLQPGNRDYIIVSYEDSKLVESHSNIILCSSNNYRTDRFIFNSFGDSNGTRKDMFRFFRLVQRGLNSLTPSNDINEAYMRVIDDMNKETAKRCGDLLCNIADNTARYNDYTEQEKNLLSFLKEIQYICIDSVDGSISINVPVFYPSDRQAVKNIGDIILSNIYPIVKEVFENFEVNAADLTAVRHKVDIKEIANELWHQIFGFTNEYLVKQGFVGMPPFINGEGRYLRSFWIKN
jgi:hypothetical protein